MAGLGRAAGTGSLGQPRLQVARVTLAVAHSNSRKCTPSEYSSTPVRAMEYEASSVEPPPPLSSAPSPTSPHSTPEPSTKPTNLCPCTAIFAFCLACHTLRLASNTFSASSSPIRCLRANTAASCKPLARGNVSAASVLHHSTRSNNVHLSPPLPHPHSNTTLCKALTCLRRESQPPL